MKWRRRWRFEHPTWCLIINCKGRRRKSGCAIIDHRLLAEARMAKSEQVRVGIGGWDYAPWRETFYPQDVPQRKALEYASRQVTSIEINGTYYRTAKPEHFASWAAQTPDDFVFSVKASRFATHRKMLAEAGESIERFIGSG